MKNYRLQTAKLIFTLIFLIVSANAQSHDQNFPTPITTNEISGRIPARDLGDARLTTYYYTFEGKQGDVFINVVTTNFNGDIDVFTADNLRPLTKITAYADSSNNETGRVVYLRQPVKLILRIEGRTPNDDAATFQIKFAGSFAASTAIADATAEPEVKSNTDSDIKVNSVGTIIEVKPKPTPTPKEVIAKVEKQPKEKKPEPIAKDAESETKSDEKNDQKPEVKEPEIKETIAAKEPKPKKQKTPKVPKKPVAVVKETRKETDTTEEKETINPETEATKETVKNEEKADGNKTAEAKEPKEKKKSEPVKPVPVAALENINLIILFKDGTKIERPMSEILKFSVDRGILTVIAKDGTIGRYSILDVEKMMVQ